MAEHRRAKGKGSIVAAGAGRRARLRLNGQEWTGPVRKGAHADRQLQRDLKKLIEDHEPGRVPRLIEWAHECLAGLYGHRLSVNSFQTADIIRRKHVNPSELAQKRLDQITRRDCMRFSSGIAGSPGTVRRVMAFLSVLFSEAIEAGILDVNPCHRLKLPAVPRRNNRVLAAHEAIRLMNPPEGDLYREMLFVYMRTGFRRSELCRAQHRDLTSDNRIWVRGTKNVVSATTHPISDDVAAVLRRQPIRSEFLFTTEQGQPVKPGTISQWFRRNKAKLGLPPEMRLHDLRGTYITLLIESGADIKTAQVLGRHATISQTAEVYAQSHFETQDEALLNMAEHIQKRSRDRAKKAAAAGQGELF